MSADQHGRFLMQGDSCMRLLVFSDLHLEHKPNWSLPQSFPDYDVCVAAGDIDGSPAESIRRLASNPGLRSKPIVFTPGNHEFYGNVLEDAIEEGRAAAAGTNVHFLNADSVTIDGVKFIGATLWTDYALHGNQELGMDAAKYGMNDHRYIKRRAIRPGTPGKFRLEPKEAQWHHMCQWRYIQKELATGLSGPTVVVTHHAPSPRSLPPRFAGDPLNVAYASDLERLIQQLKPNLWLHGHIHTSVDYCIGETRIRTNPKGYGPGGAYRGTENAAFDPQLVIELQVREPVSTVRRQA
jgi:Icc-related predicted phosphoesterase